MIVRDKTGKYTTFFMLMTISLYLLGWFLISAIDNVLGGSFPITQTLGYILINLAILQTVICVIVWCARHRLYKGIRYAFTHARLIRGIRWALLNAGTGYGIEEYAGEERVITLPKIRLELSDNLESGVLRIRDHIKYHTKLDSAKLSSALGRYRIEQQYTSDDENWSIFELEDTSVDRQLRFSDVDGFASFMKSYGGNVLIMDKKNHVPLASMLLVGATGSGKTYALYSLILQMLFWNVRPELFFADPKSTSLYVLGRNICPENSAESIDGIIELLEAFHAKMMARKAELQDKLEDRLDTDYRSWNMNAHVFVFDEFSSFQSVVATLDKKERDKVSMLLRNIVLQGRQLGFFLWFIMQKSDSNDIPTAIRDNLIWKVVLGQAATTTYITAFEQAADLPRLKFEVGHGLYTYQGYTRQPQVTSFPTLEFDILNACKQAYAGKVQVRRVCNNRRTTQQKQNRWTACNRN